MLELMHRDLILSNVTSDQIGAEQIIPSSRTEAELAMIALTIYHRIAKELDLDILKRMARYEVNDKNRWIWIFSDNSIIVTDQDYLRVSDLSGWIGLNYSKSNPIPPHLVNVLRRCGIEIPAEVMQVH